MFDDLSIPRQDHRFQEPVLVEWGGTGSTGPGRINRLLSARPLRHLPMIIAGLGVLAAFGSLVGEWSVLTVAGPGPRSDDVIRIPGGVSDIGSTGTAYLLGLLALTTDVALVLFGTPAARHTARVLALALAGGLFALLVAATVTLDRTVEGVPYLPRSDAFQIDYGRGLTLAFAATVLLGIAAGMARAHAPAGGADPADAAGPGRPRDEHAGTTDAPPPPDLTVEPAAPFVLPPYDPRSA